MPFSKSLILSLLITLLVIGCSRRQDDPPFEFSAHNLKLKYDSNANFLSVTDTITLKFNRNVDHIYFFLHDSLKVTRVMIGNQDLIPEPVSARWIENMPTLTGEIAEIMDRAQIVLVPIPKSLYPQTIQVWYSGSADCEELNAIAWHPILPGATSIFHLTALLPQNVRPRENVVLSLLECDGDWCLWRGQTREPQQLCAMQFELSKPTNTIYHVN